MKTWRWALASTFAAAGLVGLLASCSAFSSDSPGDAEAGATEGGPVGDASTEATDGNTADRAIEGDAAGLGCAARIDDPLMCADFDEPSGPRVYSEGTPSNVAPFPNRVVMAPGKSAPNAMWSDTRDGGAENLSATGSAPTTRVRVEFDVFVDPYGPAIDGALVRVGISPAQCYVDVRLQATRLLLQTHCVYTDDASDYYAFKDILTNGFVTSQWVHFVLEVDYANSKATASLDGKVKPSLDLNPSAKPGGVPFVNLGINLDKVRVGFDNVLAIASK